VERDYEELKQEVGLGHYEGRSWRGLHHHATLCIGTYGFLVAERAIFPPLEFEVSTGTFKNFPFPKITDRADLPLRTKRHVENSIATPRIRLATAPAKALPRCPCCAAIRPDRRRG
jgi:hypothetical protein